MTLKYRVFSVEPADTIDFYKAKVTDSRATLLERTASIITRNISLISERFFLDKTKE